MESCGAVSTSDSPNPLGSKYSYPGQIAKNSGQKILIEENEHENSRSGAAEMAVRSVVVP